MRIPSSSRGASGAGDHEPRDGRLAGLKHAFAVDAPGPAEPTDRQKLIVDRLCAAIVRRRLTTPTLLYLEMARPLNYLGAQALHFFRPIVAALFDTRSYEEFARFLEHRGSTDYIQRRLEALDVARGGAARADDERDDPVSRG